jgi:hypothetical protein
MKIILPILAIALLSSSCANWNHTTKDSETVQLYFSLKNNVDDKLLTKFDQKCKKLGEVIGSEGRWFNYLFIPNADLVQGALNDIKNIAYEIGADKVVLHERVQFVTSVTIVGQAYDCKAISST